MPKKKLLDIFNATVYRDEKKVFDKLSLSIKCGESAAIIGPNGAGKSSLLNCINGIYQPQEGSIAFKGEVLEKITPNLSQVVF